MKRWVVAIVALGGLASCGVGYDEGPMLASPAAAAHSQTLEEAPPPTLTTQLSQIPTNPGASGGFDGGSQIALPQDPIPLLVLPAGLPVGGLTPTFGPGIPLPPH